MDKLYLKNKIRIQRDSIIHVKRSLPLGRGEIHVRVGQEVTPGDILGEGLVPAGFHVIHLASRLGVNPAQALVHLKRQIGKNIYKGELLARRESFFGLRRKLILSPVDGIVDFYDVQKGDLRIKLLPKKTALISGVYGVVDAFNIVSGTITIKTMASLIYGVMGLGKEREGIIKILGGPDVLVTSKQLGEQLTGRIVVTGGLIFSDALEKAVDLGISGFISGGINVRDFLAAGGILGKENKKWSDVGVSLLITEGFGSISIGEDVFALLKKHDNRFVILDGNRSKMILPTTDPNSMIYIRKTQLPAMSMVETDLESQEVALECGSKVRITGLKDLGKQGVVEAIDRTPTKLLSGVSTFLVTVVTSNRKLRIPYTNLEILV